MASSDRARAVKRGHEPANASDPLVGATIGHKFVLRERIGAGSMGAVYRADQTNLGRTVAVKVLSPDLAADEAMVRRFYEEARTASQLSHPGVVSVIDFGRTDAGILYLVMELLHGRTVTRMIREEAPIPARRVVGIVCQVLDALAEAHCQGVVHRDLKTDNIMIERLRSGAEYAKVLDFGIAKLRRGDPAHETIIGPCGTPAYMPPEQIRWQPDLDGRADLYALGVVAYEMLTALTPFAGETPIEVLRRQLEEAPLPMQKARPDLPIPQEIDAVVLRALEKDRERRFRSALEMKNALQSALARRNAITLRPLGRTPAPPAASPFPLPLLPRPEWPRLAALVRARAGSALALSGPAGAGKTTLCEQAARAAEASGRTYLRIGPDPTGAARSWYPLRELLHALGVKRALAPARGSEAAAGPPAKEALLSQCASAVRSLLGTAAALTPLLLIVEDVDAFDAPSRALIARILAQPVPPGLSILLTQAGGRWAGIETVELAPLSEVEVSELARHALGPTGDALASELAHVTRGQPLHVIELLYQRAQGVESVGGLSETIAARMARLPADARALVEAVALAGGQAERTLLTSIGVEMGADALAALTAHGFVSATDASIRLRHRLLAEVASASVPEPARRALHGRLLGALTARGAETALLAHHAHKAHARDAVALCEQAGEQARNALDDAGAAAHFRHALEQERWAALSGEPGAEEALVRLSLKLAVVLHQSGETVTAEGVLREALAFAQGVPGREAWLRLALARLLREDGQLGRAQNELSEGLREGLSAGDPKLLGALYLELGTLHLKRGELGAAIDGLQVGIGLCTGGAGAAAPAGPPVLWRLLLRQAEALAQRGDAEAARTAAEQAFGHAGRVRSQIGQTRAQTLLDRLHSPAQNRLGA